MEQTKRSQIKTITWRITGDCKIGGSIAGIEVIIKMIIYYFHERIWNKIKWEKRNGGGYLSFCATSSAK